MESAAQDTLANSPITSVKQEPDQNASEVVSATNGCTDENPAENGALNTNGNEITQEQEQVKAEATDTNSEEQLPVNTNNTITSQQENIKVENVEVEQVDYSTGQSEMVRFPNEEYAQEELGNIYAQDEDIDGNTLNDPKLSEGAPMSDSRSYESLEPEQFRKIFIGALPAELTDEGLKEFYSQWGEVVDCVIMRDRETRASRRFGFIAFEKSESVDAAMRNRPHRILNKVVDPKRAIPKDATQDEWNFSTKRMYVSGVRESHTEDMLREYFSQYGTVEKVDILMDKITGKPRGFGFVNFDDSDIVDKCVLMRSHQIGGFRCDVKKAHSKETFSNRRMGGSQREPMLSTSRKRPASGGGGGGPPSRRGPSMNDAWDNAPPWAAGPNQAWSAGWAPGAPQTYNYGAPGGGMGGSSSSGYGGQWAEDVYDDGSWGGPSGSGGSGGYGGGNRAARGWGGPKGGGGRGAKGGGRGFGGKGGRGNRGGGGGRRGTSGHDQLHRHGIPL